MDSQSVKTAHGGQDIGIDGNKKVKGRKRHILVDKLGLLWTCLLTAANKPDGRALLEMMGSVQDLPRLEVILGDGAYGFANFPKAFKKKFENISLQISKRPKGNKEFVPMPVRWIVERCFAWFYMCRRLARDHEKTTESSLAFLQLSGIRRALSLLSTPS